MEENSIEVKSGTVFENGLPIAEMSTKQRPIFKDMFTKRNEPIKSKISAMDLLKTNTAKSESLQDDWHEQKPANKSQVLK